MLPFIADLPALEQERVVCSISAAVKYEVPANIVLAVAEKEGGQPDQWVRNANGTHDVGPMQFNTAYLPALARYGITADDVAAAGCYSFVLAAWRLRMHLRNDQGDIWTRAANYHSRTPKYNTIYRADLIRKAGKWANWLEAHFVTVDVMQEGAQPSMPAPPPIGQPAQSEPTRPTAAVHTANRSGYIPRRITFNTRTEGGAE